jgi:hypothetical protein
MTLSELLEKIEYGIKNGILEPDDDVKMRNTAVSEDAMEAGSNGYVTVDEVLIVGGILMLLPEEEF